MRKYTFPKFAATSIFVLSLLFSCDKEENQLLESVQDTEASNIVVEQVDFNTIPELSKALTDSSGKSVLPRSYSGKEGLGFWIDESDVLKLKDSVDNESYSIVIHSDDPSPTKLYNLVVTKRTEGDPIAPFVVEYNFEGGDRSSFAEDDEKHFEGTLNIYALSEFAKITGLNAKDDDPVICFQDIGVRDNTPADNSSPCPPGNPGGGAPSAPSTNPSRPSAIVTRTHISVNNNFRSTGVSVGIGTFYMSRPMMTNEDQDQKAHVTGKKIPDDCPEGWVSIPINEVIEDAIDPSCESFKFYKVGNTGVQVAAVNGIWDVVTKFDRCPGIGVAASYQTYYFHLPARWNSLYASERAADALAGAFYDLQKWFQKQPCSQMNTGVLAVKMDEFIKENFKEIGGQATRNAPLGWSGTPRTYKEDWLGTDDCY